MKINSVLNNLSSILIPTYDQIYLIDMNEGYYNIEIENNVIKVPNPQINKDLSALFASFNDDVLSIVKNNDKLRVVLKMKDGNEVLLILEAIQEYKVVMILYLNNKINNNILESKKTILVADDSKLITNFLTKAVGNDYNIILAENGDEVIKIVEKEKNNLVGIFLDLEMPLKNGYEVLEHFKKEDLFTSVPVSVISGEDSKDGIEKTAMYPIVDILQKPFSKEEAKAFVDKTVNIYNKKFNDN